MKNSLKLLTLAMLFHATSSWAIPMLSADGTSLTGLDVDGTIYDVKFGDGVVDTVYSGVTFDATRETEANAVSRAIVAALNLLEVSFSDIAGCDVAASTGREICHLFNPDSINPDNGRYTDLAVAYSDGRILAGEWRSTPSTGSSRAPGDTTAGNPQHTLVQYQLAATVPAPATLALFALGLVGLGWSKRK